MPKQPEGQGQQESQEPRKEGELPSQKTQTQSLPATQASLYGTKTQPCSSQLPTAALLGPLSFPRPVTLSFGLNLGHQAC